MLSVSVGSTGRGNCYCAVLCPISGLFHGLLNWKNSVPRYFCSRLLQVSDVHWNEKWNACANDSTFQMSIRDWFILAFLSWNCCPLVFFFFFFLLNRKLFLPESLMHKQNNVSCKTKQTLPIRLPLWGSVQCWYFHESVFQNLKGNNRRLWLTIGWKNYKERASAWQHDLCCAVNSI